MQLLRKIVFIPLFMVAALPVFAQENKPKGLPPANVVVADVRSGMIAPEVEFVGTVFYQEISDVASEVSGRVLEVRFDEGRNVRKGDVLVRLDSELLEKTLQSHNALYQQAVSELENARADLRRMEGLFREELVSEKTYDDHRYRVTGLEKRAAALKAEVERLEAELSRKEIRAPFNGVVVKKSVERGEWVSPGTAVLTLARDETVDVIVEVPEAVMKVVKPGTGVKVKAGSREITGKVFSITPKGDIATRTFPVRIRIPNAYSLIEGMEALVLLPSGKQEKTFIVPRDAVITMFGKTVVFTVEDSKARMVAVRVAGYKGLTAGIAAEGIADGSKVITKGHERLMDGQAVVVVNDK